VIERRRAERIPMNPPTNPVSVVGARILDVSAFGMRIQSPVAISPDSVLPFRIAVGGQTTDVRCRVAACRPTTVDASRFGIGLEFLNLDPAFRERMVEALQRYASDTPKD
jgi:hypothetical protein